MNIDRGSFVIHVGPLAAGGAGGYLASDQQVFAKREPGRSSDTPPAQYAFTTTMESM